MNRTIQQLREMQAWTLYQKIDHSIGAIEKFCRDVDNPVISFSGGKDSTVLMHLVRSVMKKDIPAVFVNTGNEYLEIIKFATKKFSNTGVIRPKTHLRKIIEKYGFPLISKEYSKMIYELRRGSKHASRYITGFQSEGKPTSFTLPKKYHFLIDAQFSCSHKCCDFLKKSPVAKLNSITGEMSVESFLREKSWLRTGCNSFGIYSKSKPLSIWTERDIWEYKRLFDIDFCELYDDPRIVRTGCMFCGFGATFEHLSRFEVLKERHPKVYDYFLKIENSGITYCQALNAVGVILPDDTGYQHNIFSNRQK